MCIHLEIEYPENVQQIPPSFQRTYLQWWLQCTNQLLIVIPAVIDLWRFRRTHARKIIVNRRQNLRLRWPLRRTHSRDHRHYRRLTDRRLFATHILSDRLVWVRYLARRSIANYFDPWCLLRVLSKEVYISFHYCNLKASNRGGVYDF